MTTLVLLPGMDGTGELFADFIAALGNGVTTVVIAYPTETALDYSQLVDFVRERLPCDGSYFLLGESFSGPIAIAIAAARPPGLIGLILCCTFARNPRPLFHKAQIATPYLPLPLTVLPLVAPLLLGRGADPIQLKRLRQALGKLPAAIVRHRMREVLRVDYSDRLACITVPVLYLQALRDKLVPPSATEHLSSLLPVMKTVGVAGPHLLLQTKALAAATVLLSFMAAAQATA